jgi:hypothetical protein
MKNFGEQFLNKKDPTLHASNSVEHEQMRKDSPTEKKADKIADWLKVIEQTHTSHEDNPRVLERIKDFYHKEYVIKKESIPESTFILEQRIARQLGRGTIELTDDFRSEKSKQIISDQEHSLDRWINYLSSSETSDIPMWAKYWVFTSMVKMGKFEKYEDQETGKEIARFKNRTTDTVASFPPLNALALRNVVSAIKNKVDPSETNLENLSTKLNDDEFKKLIDTENFSKLYTQFLIELPQYSAEGLKETRGRWVVYPQGSQPDELVKSLDGHPLEWCTANIDTARTQLQGGDFHVYYSIDSTGEPTIPRVAIRMEAGSIAEVRGIAPDQNVDPYIGDVIAEKMTEFSDGESYKKKSEDMKRVTEIEKKVNEGEKLNKEELCFIYEVDESIQGFGYQKDPRIKEILSSRKLKEDLLVLFECSSQQVATNLSEINEHTTVYIGDWNPAVHAVLPHTVEHVYNKTLENKVFRKTIELSTKTSEEYTKELTDQGYKISAYAGDMLNKLEPLQTNTEINLVSFAFTDLGFLNYPTVQQIHDKARELGLSLCEPHAGPEMRLQFADQKNGTYFYCAMEPISDRYDYPRLWEVGRRDDGGALLFDSNGKPEDIYRGVYTFVFAFSKKSPQDLKPVH